METDLKICSNLEGEQSIMVDKIRTDYLNAQLTTYLIQRILAEIPTG